MTTRECLGAGNKKRRRAGGCKQHVAGHDAAMRAAASGSVDGGVETMMRQLSNDETIDARSSLALGLMKEVMWGFLSPSMAHRIATWGIADGITKADLVALSKMGSSGIHTRNVWRDIKTKLKSPEIARAKYSIKLELKPRNQNTFECDTDVLLPHRLLAAMWTSEREEFNTRIIGGDLSNVSRLWTEMK